MKDLKMLFELLLIELENLMKYSTRIVEYDKRLVMVTDYNSLKNLVERYRGYYEKLQHFAKQERMLHMSQNKQLTLSSHIFRKEQKGKR